MKRTLHDGRFAPYYGERKKAPAHASMPAGLFFVLRYIVPSDVLLRYSFIATSHAPQIAARTFATFLQSPMRWTCFPSGISGVG